MEVASLSPRSPESLFVPWFSQGLVAVWELQLERRGRPERVSMSWEHRGQQVTALCWDSGSLRVFAGDLGGKVSFLRAGSTKLGKVPGLMGETWGCFVFIVNTGIQHTFL